MAQNREKEKTVPSDSPLYSLPSSYPDTKCKIPPGSRAAPDPTWMDLKKKAMEQRARSEELSSAATEPQSMRAAGSGEAEEAEAATLKKKAANRCSECGKRVGLTGYRCRCGDLFCSQHRYTDRHDCSYDYKTTA